MPIDPEFYKKLKKSEDPHENSAAGDKHFVWGRGKERDLDFSGISDENKRTIDGHISEKGYEGIHGTTVAVDQDLCIADGSCLSACPVLVFGWSLQPGDGPTSNGPGNNKDEYDKSDPYAEKSCIFCMACETVCPTSAIKIQEGLLDQIK